MNHRFARRLSSAIVVSAAMSAVAGVARAQAVCNGGSTCNFAISAQTSTNYVARLVLSSATSTLTPPTAINFNDPAGVNTAGAVTLEVRSNATYTITAVAPSAFFTGGSNAKPSSSVQYTTNAFGTLKSVSGTGSQLASAAAATATTTYTIGYKTTYSWTQDTPGTYTLAINYTLTAP